MKATANSSDATSQSQTDRTREEEKTRKLRI